MSAALPLAERAAGESKGKIRMDLLDDQAIAKLQRLLGGKREATPAPVPQLPPGNQCGKYRLIRMLGPQSWEASDGKRPTALVLRVLGQTRDQSVVAAVCAELRPLSALQHPVIVGYHKLSTVGGGYFTVRDYVNGESLENRALNPITGLQVFYEVARAIEYAHDRGIVHGGLGPSNVIVASSGHPLVVDFAIRHLKRHFQGRSADAPPAPAADLEALHTLFLSLASGKPFAEIAGGAAQPTLRPVHPAADPVLAEIARTTYPSAGAVADAAARALQQLPDDYSSDVGLLERYKLRSRTA